jgi:predicted nucleic-acid-binding protein
MIGLDTNLLVRYLVQDDPVQSPMATEIIEKRLSERDPGFISTVAIVELAWVLDSVYRFTGEQVAGALEFVLKADALVVENETQVNAAALAFKQGEGSFQDALIAELGAKAGCMHTLTFDRKAARLPEFELVPTPPPRGGRRK